MRNTAEHSHQQPCLLKVVSFLWTTCHHLGPFLCLRFFRSSPTALLKDKQTEQVLNTNWQSMIERRAFGKSKLNLPFFVESQSWLKFWSHSRWSFLGNEECHHETLSSHSHLLMLKITLSNTSWGHTLQCYCSGRGILPQYNPLNLCTCSGNDCRQANMWLKRFNFLHCFSKE